jgi:hypothetical protein
MPKYYNYFNTNRPNYRIPSEKEIKNRNNTVRKLFNAKGIPRNMADQEILGRVKVYDNAMTRKNILNFNSNKYDNQGRKLTKIKIANFISNGRVFNQGKRKALVKLMLRFDIGRPAIQGGHILEILALKNEDVIRYIKYMAEYFGTDGVVNTGMNNYVPHYIFNLMNKYRIGTLHFPAQGRRGPIREDPGAVRVLKKRTAFLEKMLNIRGMWYYRNAEHEGEYTLNRDNLPRNMQNKFRNRIVSRRDIWRFMEKEFPLPPHPKNAATKIQKTVRGMRNRKKLTTMRKAATTIQKTVRGVRARTTVKKMKTVAGRVSLRGKRKRSPQ